MPLRLSVSQVNRHLADLLQSDPVLQDLWVEGELSNFSRSAAGHCYFTLKDDSSQLQCVLFKREAESVALRLGRPSERLLTDGEKLEVRGRIEVYQYQGRYQLYAVEVRPVGEGELYQRFLALKAKLQAEGLFDRPPRPLPRFPRRIGLVTSGEAAARRDIQNILARRYPLAQLFLAPTLVQGAEAPLQIVSALQCLYDQQPAMDAIIVARGGGSIEELWAFNDERVARRVAASPVPIVTGVGHETDFTIVDFVSDVRAPTPSAAAELVSPSASDLGLAVAQARRHLAAVLARRLALHRREVAARRREVHRNSPRARLRQLRQRLDELLRTSTLRVHHGLAMRRERLAGQSGKLLSLSPLAVLDRGYSITYHEPSDRILRDARGVRHGDALRIRLAKGELPARADTGRGKAGPPSRPAPAEQMVLLTTEESR